MTDSQTDKLRAFLEQRKKETQEKEIVNEEVEGSTSVSDDDGFSDALSAENDVETTPVVENSKVLEEPESNSQQEVVKDDSSEEIQPPATEEKIASTSPTPIPAATQEEIDIDSEKEREANLKAFLNRRREDNVTTLDDDDPFGGDGIARKNLRYLQKYLDRHDIADIKEIVINKPEEVGLEYADGHWDWIKDPDLTLEQLEDIARTLANRSGQLFHSGNPMLSVKMPGGHRVQIVSGFNTPSGFVFSMRLQRKEKFGLKDFKMPDEEREKIKELVKAQKTILISGGTGTGKTSFMNALIPSIPDHERLITMEDVPELKIPHKNWAPLLFSASDTATGDQGVLELLNACLRLRPDRIILGEIRKENAFAFCSAINTGHEGSMATIHANSPKMALDAVINRVMMNGDLPDSAMMVLRRQLIHDIFAVVQLTRVKNTVEASLTVLQGNEDELGVEEE